MEFWGGGRRKGSRGKDRADGERGGQGGGGRSLRRGGNEDSFGRGKGQVTDRVAADGWKIFTHLLDQQLALFPLHGTREEEEKRFVELFFWGGSESHGEEQPSKETLWRPPLDVPCCSRPRQASSSLGSEGTNTAPEPTYTCSAVRPADVL